MNTTLLLQLLVNGLIVGALYGVVAMCFVLIYKASQVVNFAQGGNRVDRGLGVLVAGCLAQFSVLGRLSRLPRVHGLLGVLVQVVVLRPLIGEPVISIVMVTIGALDLLPGAAQVDVRRLHPAVSASVLDPDGQHPSGSTSRPPISSLAISLVIMAGFAWFLPIFTAWPRHAGHGLRSSGGAEPWRVGQAGVCRVLGDLGGCLGMAGVVVGLVSGV